MNGFGLTLSDQLDMQGLEITSESKGKMFNYFNYPTNKVKEKPFSTIDYSLDDSINIILDDPPVKDNKYDKIIEGQEKLIELLKQENGSLRQKITSLQSVALNYQPPHYNFAQELLPICYLLNLDINSQYIYTEIYQSIENVMTQLLNNQNRVRELEKKAKQTGMQRVNSTTYLEKPYGRDHRSKRGGIQYKQKSDVEHVERLQNQIRQLKQQCSKLKASPQEPRFISSIKEKKVEVIVEKIVEKVVEKIVEVEKKVFIDKIVERPVIVEKLVDKPVYFEKRVKEQVPIYIEKIVEKPTPIYIDREIEVEKVVMVRQNSKTQLIHAHTQTQN